MTKKPASSLKPTASLKRVAAEVVAKPTSKVVQKKPSLDFIGTFPLRKSASEKKLDTKKQPQGPVFPQGSYRVGHLPNSLSEAFKAEFEGIYHAKHTLDKVAFQVFEPLDPSSEVSSGSPTVTAVQSILNDILTNKLDMAVLNMKDVPLDLPTGLILGAALRREDPRDALITKATYGAIQELPSQARVGASSKRRVMQIRALRPDIKVESVSGSLFERIERLEKGEVDAVMVAWATLRRLNHSPRFYVALQPELMIPAACQGTLGVVCRADDKDLISKLRYVEDSEASWSARCERAFLTKLGSSRDIPVGVYAHRKGTQDPWILDAVIGNQKTGETLKHREIGTSRCKPESLADKAYVGILSKGARKFMPFGS